jgi:hypothetical protein
MLEVLSFGTRILRSSRVVGSAAAARPGFDFAEGAVLGFLGGVLVGAELGKEG